jgi:hypothetical protein
MLEESGILVQASRVRARGVLDLEYNFRASETISRSFGTRKVGLAPTSHYVNASNDGISILR